MPLQPLDTAGMKGFGDRIGIFVAYIAHTLAEKSMPHVQGGAFLTRVNLRYRPSLSSVIGSEPSCEESEVSEESEISEALVIMPKLVFQLELTE